jgi:hypothetical protein
MLSRWFLMTIVAVALVTAVRSERSDAVAGTVTQACSAAVPGATTLTVAWPAPGAGATQTWFDISLVPGFAPGWFKGHGPLAPSQTAYAIDGVPKNLTFYYRVNTLYGSQWRETASGSFVSNCGGGGGSAKPAPVGVTQACDPYGRVSVTFNWQANAPGPQFIDLSVFNNGFAPGTFVGAGPIAGGSFTWHGIARGLGHFWRVNTLTPSGWIGSDTAFFSSLTCQPPMKACVGYMMGYTASGLAECEQLVAQGGKLGDCIGYIIKKPGYTNQASCVNPGVSGPYLSDCLLGLSGQSHFGRTSCRLWYESN